ncbi:MAG: transcriptional regulator GlxA family with amidase domain [Crocinitomicaceae bacterium]|jgi:transcriptional regulator GlxA family with amidase domain
MKNLLILLSALFLFGCSNQKTDPEPEKAAVKNEVKLDKDNYNVAFLIMTGTFNTELTAPYDIYQHTKFRDGIKAMNVFTVANTNEPITTFEGLRILPDFNYLEDKLPQIDILVIPSAEHNLDSDLEDSKMIDFVRRVSKDARFITSHCDGAFVLAKAGVLDDRASTTFPADIEAMRKMFPELDIRDETLFVHDGNVITSAGGAKSFEASLYLCELLYGKEVTDQIAEGMVIDWNLKAVPHTIR